MSTPRNTKAMMQHGLKPGEFRGTTRFLRELLGDNSEVEMWKPPLPGHKFVIAWANRHGAQVAVHINNKQNKTLAIHFPDAAIHQKFVETQFGLFDEVVKV